MIKILLLQIFSVITLFAVEITLNKTTYTPQEDIEITLSDMPSNNGDWVGIFLKDSENIWENVKTWKHDGEVIDGTYTLDGVGVGEYEARVFLDNSYTLLAKKEFSVNEVPYSTRITTSKVSYEENEPIVVTLTDMPGNSGDWVGIFPKDSISTWENVITWKHDGAVVDGTYTLSSLVAGEYEARVFLHNSYTQLAKVNFSVEEQSYNVTITTSKTIFEVGEGITVSLSNMPNLGGDWIGVYPKDSNDSWENIIAWKHDGTVVDGNHTLDSVEAGEYEARVFLNNSFTRLAVTTFTVEEQQLNTAILTNKDNYLNGENIIVTYSNMLGNPSDWIGIFPSNANNDINEVMFYKKTNGQANGTLTLSGIKAGEYEVRAFFNNSLEERASTQITVTYSELADTVYENASDSTTNGWRTLEGNKQIENRSLNGDRVIYIPHDWKNVNGNMINQTLYELKNSDGSYWENAVQKTLQADMHPYHSWGRAACYDFGVRAQTVQGERIILFSVWYGNKNFVATKTEYSDNWIELVYPITRDLVFQNRQQYVDLNLQEYLEVLEPNNRILSIKSFITSGGNYVLDNLRLSSQ